MGRTHFDWSAAEPLRGVSAWVWYPAAPLAGAEPAEWMPGSLGQSYWTDFVRRYADAAALGEKHPVGSLRTHAFADAPVAPGPAFPLLVFAPGVGNDPLQYSSLIEDLASQGYVVAGLVPPSSPPQTASTGASDGDARQRAVQARDDLARQWAADLRVVLDRMAALNARAGAPLRGRLAMDVVGAFGHSLGGTASLLLEDDPRVRAVFDIDGPLTMDLARSGGLSRPLLVLSSAFALGGPLAAVETAAKDSAATYHLRLAGASHMFSADIGALPFVPASAKGEIPTLASAVALAAQGRGGASGGTIQIALPLVGPLDPVRGIAITRAYAAAFFAQYLRATSSPLLDGPSAAFPEITFEYRSVRDHR